MKAMIAACLLALVGIAGPASAQSVYYTYGCGGTQLGPGLGNKIFGYSNLADTDHVANGDDFQSEVSIDGITLTCGFGGSRIGPGGCKKHITVSQSNNAAYGYGQLSPTAYYGGFTSRHKMYWIIGSTWHFVNEGSDEVNQCSVSPPLPCPPGQYCPPTPIVVPLGKSPSVKISGPEVLFDLDADGDQELVGWPIDGGLLVQDRNGDGEIRDGRELYGSVTIQGAFNGFDALAREAGANTIDATTALWSKLKVWVDANRDGITQPGELEPVTNYFQRIFAFYEFVGKKDENGNEFRYKGQAVYADGEQRPLYDVIFSQQP